MIGKNFSIRIISFFSIILCPIGLSTPLQAQETSPQETEMPLNSILPKIKDKEDKKINKDIKKKKKKKKKKKSKSEKENPEKKAVPKLETDANNYQIVRQKLLTKVTNSKYYKPNMSTKEYIDFISVIVEQKKLKNKKIKSTILKDFFYLGKVDVHFALKSKDPQIKQEAINCLNMAIINQYRTQDAERLLAYLKNFSIKTEDESFYLEVKIGQNNYNSPKESESLSFLKANVEPVGISINAVTATKIESSATGFSIGGGYFLSKWMAVEVFYNQSGKEKINISFEHSGSTVTGSYKADRTFSSLDFNSKFIYKFSDKFKLYGGIGLNLWQIKFDEFRDVDSITSDSLDSTGLKYLYFGGFDFFINESLFMGLGGTHYPSFGSDKVGSFTITRYEFKFGYLFLF